MSTVFGMPIIKNPNMPRGVFAIIDGKKVTVVDVRP